MNLYTGATLKNLIDTLGPVKKADRTPTSRKLREEAGEPFITTDSIHRRDGRRILEQRVRTCGAHDGRLITPR